MELLLNYDAEVDIADEENSMTPLMYAVTCGVVRASELLIRDGADVNLSDKNGVTALMMACRYRSFYLVFLSANSSRTRTLLRYITNS